MERVDRRATRLFDVSALTLSTGAAFALQAWYVTFEAELASEIPPLFPQPFARALSCLVLPALAFLGCRCLAYPRRAPASKHLALAALVAATPAILLFEFLHATLPLVILSHEPPRAQWSGVFTSTAIVFAFTWFVAFIMMTMDADRRIDAAPHKS